MMWWQLRHLSHLPKPRKQAVGSLVGGCLKIIGALLLGAGVGAVLLVLLFGMMGSWLN